MWNLNWVAGTCIIVILWMTSFAESAEPVDYLRDVKPILSSRCYACHGALKQESELRLDAGRMILKGGDSGLAIITGKSAESLLVQRISDSADSRMPPEGEPLTPAQIDLIKAWIDAGAKSPANETLQANPREHWSFKTPLRPPFPDVKNNGWVRNPIDAFVAVQHDELGLTPQPPADKDVLLRRVYLDLIGLPPSPEELRAFVSDSSTNAYETVVNRLLDSRHYGERWGRHWMDIWGYADAHGRSSQLHIWKWRDWIIESLNADKGYDRMIIEMFAGDELAPGDPDVLRATGFLGRKWFTANPSRAWTGAVEHAGEALLGLTFRCAACHDHKFDPVSQEEYYRFTAFFRPFNVRYDHVSGQPDVTKNAVSRVYDKDLDAPTYLNVSGRGPDKDHPLTPGVPEALGKLKGKIEPITLSLYQYYPTLRPWVIKQTIAAAEAKVDAALVALEKARAVKTPDKKQLVALAEKKHSAAAAELESLKARAAADQAKYTGEGNADELAPLAAKAECEAAVAKADYEVLQNQQELNAARQVLKANDAKTKQAVADAEKKLTNARKALDTARADVKKIDAAYTSFGPVYPKTSTGRRLALARWIASSDNPRTARVAVNHIWLRHFVPEVMNFGAETPATHRLYGLDQGTTRPLGERCLAARRLVERGVRFVQIYHGGLGDDGSWDSHFNMNTMHGKMCRQADKPIAALLKDLKQRDLLDETLVVWGTEFGRTPGGEDIRKWARIGRDHHPYGFSIWMAGGGIKGGIAHGATDEIGFHAVENRHYVTDIHATVLHQLGLDPHRLEVPGYKRLEIDFGKPIQEIIA